MDLNIMNPGVWLMTLNGRNFWLISAWRFCDFPTVTLTGIFVECANKLKLPFNTGYKALSVTCGDSSPKGRAKAACNRMYGYKKWSVSVLIRSINYFTDIRPNWAVFLYFVIV